MNVIKVVTAAALYDGHDVSINIFRRLLQKRGAEVIHLGHNRSVEEVVTVAVQEDVDGILVSSYQGGHNEYFKYIIDKLKELGSENIMVFGGGGGVILPSEIKNLENYGVERIYHAIDGQKIGIDGIADDIIKKLTEKKESNSDNISLTEEDIKNTSFDNHKSIANQLSFFENNHDEKKLKEVRELYKKYDKNSSVVLGVTGTGGSGKSSLIDEIIGRFLSLTDDTKIGILAIDPSKSRGGGALLGDRIRYNQIYNERVYFRSFATRQSGSELHKGIMDSIAVMKAAGYDLIIVETSGIGQGDSTIVDVSDYSLYVMTAEFGAPSQLEKIQMLDVADFIAINKFEKRGSEDAYREVLIHNIRTHNRNVDHKKKLEELELPVYACASNNFNNFGVNRLFKDILNLLQKELNKDLGANNSLIDLLPYQFQTDFGLLDNNRVNYLSDIAATVRAYHEKANHEAGLAANTQALKESIEQVEDENALKVLNDTYDRKWFPTF